MPTLSRRIGFRRGSNAENAVVQQLLTMTAAPPAMARLSKPSRRRCRPTSIELTPPRDSVRPDSMGALRRS